jgi:hypothetical protein
MMERVPHPTILVIHLYGQDNTVIIVIMDSFDGLDGPPVYWSVCTNLIMVDPPHM